MRKQYHILNGDSLRQQLPKQILGETIVARECLVDGNVKGDSLAELYRSRAEFICQNYQDISEIDYYEKTVREFQKTQNITDEADINLWFEDDLFCQVNLWFIVYLLLTSNQKNPVFLVRPRIHSQYGFGGLSESELISIYDNKVLLTDLDKLSDLWVLYQNDDTEKMLKLGKSIQKSYPFVLPAIRAHVERLPNKRKLGKPSRTLIEIMRELETEEFETIFKEFCRRESIYGFGDSQVRRLLNDIKASR